MRIILSRKGFDSSSGGCPSPILPNGQLRSLPIPECCSNIKYSQIYADDDYPTGAIIESLTKCKRCGVPSIAKSTTAHLDPDIDKKTLARESGWRGLFGQSGNAQSELREVTEGDLFLFLGVFQKTTGDNVKSLQFTKGEAKKHVIFGWLQVGQIIDLVKNPGTAPSWSRYHPHIASAQPGVKQNTLYIAREKLNIPGTETKLPG